MLSKPSLTYLLILMLCTGCSSAKVLSTIKTPDGSEYLIKTGRFSSCDYVTASNTRTTGSRSNFTIDFKCRFYLRKQVYDNKGNYITAFHPLTDTTGKVRFFDMELIPELEAVRLKKGITPISSHEIFLLNAINRELIKKRYKHAMPEDIGGKIIGWVSSE